MPPKKVAGIAASALFALLAGGWFFGLCLEKYYVGKLERYFQSMPGRVTIAEIQVAPFKSQARLFDYVGEFVDARGGRHFFTADTLVLTGLNFDAGKEAGVGELAQKLEGETIFMHFAGPDFAGQRMELELSVEKLSVTGARGDLAHIKHTALEDYTVEPVQAVLSTVEADAVSVTGYKFKSHSLGGTLELSASSVSFTELRTGHARNLACDDLLFRFQNQDVLHLDALRMGLLHVPQVQPLPPEMGMDFTMAILEKLRTDPVIVEGMRLQGLTLSAYGRPAPRLGGLEADVRLGTHEAYIVGAMSDFVLPKEIYEAFGGKAGALAAVYGDDLLFSGSIDARLSKQQGPGRIALAKGVLQEKRLGGFALTGDFLFSNRLSVVEFVLDGWGGDILLQRCTLALTDTGGVGELLRAGAKAGQADLETDALRQAEAATLRREADDMDNPDKKTLTEGLAAIAATPGTLRIILAPKDPVRLDNLESWNVPRLNLEAVFSPAGQ